MIILSIVFIILILLLIAWRLDVHGDHECYVQHVKSINDNHVVSLTFKQFIVFYNLNPSKYVLSDNYPVYITPKKTESHSDRPLLFINDYDVIRMPIIFEKYSDQEKYRKWVKNMEKTCAEETQDKTTLAYLERVKEDIRKKEDEVLQNIEEVTTGIQSVLNK